MSRARVAVAAATAVIAASSLVALGAATFPFRTAPAPVAAPPAVALKAAATVGIPPTPPAHRVAQDQSDDIVRIGGDLKPPKKIKHVNPVYPPEAKEAGVEGVVIIEAVIDKAGKVAHAEVVKSVPELDQAALDAVLQWEYEPSYVNGKKVRVRMTITINFTLA